MTLDLRPYQDKLYADARARVQGGTRSLLIQSPTGSGKTVLIAKMLKTAADRGYRAWFNVHRRELVKQSVMTLTESAGMEIGIVAADFPGNRHSAVQVCSIQTLRNRRHLLQRPQLIIWDEAHHVAAATWDGIFQEHQDAIHIGLTATPERLDGTGLGRWFGDLLTGPTVAELIRDGWLCDYKLLAPPGPDLSSVHLVGGDYNKKELAEAMRRSTVTGDAISHYQRHAAGKRAVLFSWSVESSVEMAARFRAAGISAEHVDGETDNLTRDAAMDRFRSGETLVLTNVDLFGEGVDVPAMEAVMLLRPTQSLTLYLQQVGRALRPYPGKELAIILDHAGNSRRFGLPDDERQWSLLGRQKRRGSEDGAPIKMCPQCFAALQISAELCRYCGHKFESVAREITEVDGDLVTVDIETKRKQRIEEQHAAQTLEDLVELGRLRGYKHPERWANHLYNARAAREAAVSAARDLRSRPLMF